MKHENWEQVETIFHQAIAVNGEQRKEFLTATCSGDDLLLAEVESLITAFEDESELLEEPTLELSLSVIHQETQSSRSNTKVGIYKIGEKIGSGGMGEVYEAVDTNLNRRVALKFLHDSLANDNSARRLLVKEAQAAAALEHPNICAVYGIEQADDHHFIVMQYIEGKTLDESFEGKKIQIDDFKRIARQILEAVAFAHSHGVIHRDLKPGNIMVNSEGLIKVLDFGLAKVISKKQFNPQDSEYETSHYSNAGLIIGTVSYMSPEQLKGEKLDYQSDLFSVGIILYELISNQNPFNRQSEAETIAAILSYEPTTLKTLKPELPDNLVRLIERCLSKDKDSRFHSAAEILVELNTENSEKYSSKFPRMRRSIRLKVAFAITVLIIGVVFFYSYFGSTQVQTIAVLPISFEQPIPDKDYLADGLTQSIIDKLSNLSDFKVKSESLVSKYKGKAIDPQIVGNDLNAEAVFIGVITERENQLFLKTRIIRTSDGVILDNYEVRVEESNMIVMQENISSRIIDKMKSNLSSEDKDKLAKKETESEEAKRLYALGRFHLKRQKDGDDLPKAIQYFTDAKDIDQNYAKAWAGLADAYISLSSPGVKRAIPPKSAVELAKKAANRALELDNTLSESYNSLGLISLRYEWNWKEAESHFRHAINNDPEFLPARIGLINVLKMQERYDEAMGEALKVKEFDPLSITSDLQIALIHYRRHQFDEVDRILSELLQRVPNDVRVKYLRVYQFLKTDRFAEAVEILEPFYDSNSQEDKVLAAAPLGFAYAKMGRRSEALKIIVDLGTFRKNNYVPAQEKALIYVGLGDYDNVFVNLNLSCAEKFSSLPGWVFDPIVDEVKSDPRFAAIKKCVNL